MLCVYTVPFHARPFIASYEELVYVEWSIIVFFLCTFWKPLLSNGKKGVAALYKRVSRFPVPAGMSLTKLFLGGNNLIFPAQEEFGQ